MEGPKGPGPDLKRGPPLPALHGPYGSPSRRPQGCQGSAARAPRHQVAAIVASWHRLLKKFWLATVSYFVLCKLPICNGPCTNP